MAIRIPHFAADDPRVNEAGFFGQTLRLTERVGETDYTLMAFRVGDAVTLGAMAAGPFDGRVEWLVGGASVTLPFRDEPSESESPADVQRGPGEQTEIVGRRAAFRGTRWINIDLDANAWLPEGTALRLRFTPEEGEGVTLPAAGSTYEVAFLAR